MIHNYWKCFQRMQFLDSRFRSMSTFSRFLKWYRDLWESSPVAPKPPYVHVCQIGDPILRSKAEQVRPDVIKTDDLQKVISRMKLTLKHYKLCGLSAPQIGVPLRIILVDFSENTLLEFSPEIRRSREMTSCPLTIIINPSVEVINSKKVVFTEGCQSLSGFSASVPRYYEVKVSGINENAENFSWQVKGWLARIIQHEMDHIDGKFFIDSMDPLTFQFDNWFTVNLTKGQYRHRFK